jgi:Raf kinase inhibitor-like YbhB/YbcL family protein
MRLHSPAFQEGKPIPTKFTGEGPDVSPALAWDEAPAGTRSFTLICDDPDAPRGTWVHWVLYNLPPETRSLPEGVPAEERLPSGALQGTTDFQRIGYGGPMPPPGKPHRYFFKLYALDTPLNLAPGATKAQVEQALHGHVLGQAQLMGTYQR